MPSKALILLRWVHIRLPRRIGQRFDPTGQMLHVRVVCSVTLLYRALSGHLVQPPDLAVCPFDYFLGESQRIPVLIEGDRL